MSARDLHLAFNDSRLSSSMVMMMMMMMKKKKTTTVTISDRVLDAPGLIADIGSNVIDWGCKDLLAVALKNKVHFVYLGSKERCCTAEIDAGDGNVVSCVNWASDGYHIALGLKGSSSIQLWDTTCNLLVRTLRDGHAPGSQVRSLSWNGNILTTGGSDGCIVVNDPRLRDSSVHKYHRRRVQICGLTWSTTGCHQLASGYSDGLVHIWDARCQRIWQPPVYCFTAGAVNAGIRALSWCPFQDNLLATGGAATSRKGCIKFWSTASGKCINTLDTGLGPVLALVWSKSKHQILSSSASDHLDDLMTVWDYPTMSRAMNLVGHTSRVLYVSQSADGCRIASAAGGSEEMIRLWNVFPPVPKEAAVADPFATSYHAHIRYVGQMTFIQYTRDAMLLAMIGYN